MRTERAAILNALSPMGLKMGWSKTRSVFERYAIVRESDMVDAIERVEAHRAQLGHSQSKNARNEMQSNASRDRDLISVGSSS
jgi:hypothetical protein